MTTRLVFTFSCVFIILAVTIDPTISALPNAERIDLLWKGLTTVSAVYGAEALIMLANKKG